MTRPDAIREAFIHFTPAIAVMAVLLACLWAQQPRRNRYR